MNFDDIKKEIEEKAPLKEELHNKIDNNIITKSISIITITRSIILKIYTLFASIPIQATPFTVPPSIIG